MTMLVFSPGEGLPRRGGGTASLGEGYLIPRPDRFVKTDGARGTILTKVCYIAIMDPLS